MHTSNDKEMEITVLMSVYNGERWLCEAIESIIKQTYKNYEFLIIDDGSTDNTNDILNNYSIQDTRIRIFRHENLGLTKSLNKGLNLAKGKWIARIDSDDIALPKRLSLQHEYAIKNKVKLVGSQYEIIDEDNKKQRQIKIPLNNKELKYNLIKQKAIFPHSSAFFNLSTAKNLGLYREKFTKSQDYDLYIRFSEKAKIGCIKETAVIIRDHNKRISFEDKGVEQKIMGHSANISRILRETNQNDPMGSGNTKSESDIFINFVNRSLIKYNYVNFYKKLMLYKQITANNSLKIKIINFIKIFKEFYYLFMLIKWKIEGDSISYKISRDWLNYIKDKNGK